ncbi:MAG TPA: protein-methionine-sulfoxide reductase heme-binding subunit MsrQ [Bryobacteraceae bacterium]|jgi:sulfoxide reductase heme-binding subunit YedZ|nr:protein-methionine-sulfoxide reductase heme-binding subunit MsrQ [Bryobacteraceae bacterium]
MWKSRWVKPVIWLVCLTPFVYISWLTWQGNLGPNPPERVEHFTGDWTLRLIVASLAITPLRRLLRQPNLIRFRRLIGLFAFFYACLHFLSYVVLDQFFDFHAMIADVLKRPYITVGFTGFVLLIPLAVTSTVGWIRRLGGKRWQALHRLIYVTAIAGVLHYYWLVKSDVRLPLLYAGLVALELGYRFFTGKLVRKAVAA